MSSLSTLSDGWTNIGLQRGTFTFVSYMPKFISKINSDGSSEKNIIPSELKFLRNGINDMNLPKNLQELLNIINDKYVSYGAYVNASGNIANHDCWQYNDLMVDGYTDEKEGTVAVARTEYGPSSGGPVQQCSGTYSRFNNECWKNLYSGKKILKKLTTFNHFVSGSGCSFFPKGGWSDITVSLLMFVNVNVVEYCTEPGMNNIGSDFCFDLMENYFSQKGSAIEGPTTRYIEDYCQRNIPDGNLSSASTVNKKICACNMPNPSYDVYKSAVKNVSGVQVKCYLNDCLNSHFKPAILNKCPLPQCLQVVNIDRSTIPNLNVKQNADCVNILREYQPTEEESGNNNTDEPENNITELSFWEKYKILIIIGVVITIIIISLGIYFMMG